MVRESLLFLSESTLGIQRGRESLGSGGEGSTESIPDGFEDVPIMLLNSRSKYGVMALQGTLHLLRVSFPAPGASLYVCEEERDCAARELVPRHADDDGARCKHRA